MTARQVFEGVLIELSKVNAPSMLLLDFNYLFNKALYLYINKRYNIYDINQLTTDDLRVLKATAILTPEVPTVYNDLKEYGAGMAKLFEATYEIDLPEDYMHMLNCVCIYQVNKNYKCYNKNDYVQFAAKRLTADSWSVIVNDFYNRPLPERPYYYIHNVNISPNLPTNEGVTDLYYQYDIATNGDGNIAPEGKLTQDSSGKNPGDEGYTKTTEKAVSNFPRTITLTGSKKKEDGTSETRLISTVEKETALRYGNPSRVRCEIRYGRDHSVFTLKKVLVDYIKTPQFIRLTLELIDLTEDTSLIMEFPDYVCQEIINELVILVMENTADPRLRTHPVVTESIANPVQQLTPQPTTSRTRRDA